MSTKKSIQASTVENTADLFKSASQAGENALEAFGNVRAKARAFVLASYTAIVSAQALEPADYEALMVRLFDDKRFERPKNNYDVHSWFRGFAPDEFVRKDKFKSTRSKWAKAISNGLRAKLTPDQAKEHLDKGGIHGLSLDGPSLEQQRDMDAEQDQPEELTERNREAEEAREQSRKAHGQVQSILSDPQRSPFPISPYREALEVSAEEIVSAIRRAERPAWCLAVVRVDPVRKRGEELVSVQIESSSIDLLTADPRRIRTALKSMREEPAQISRTIIEMGEDIERVIARGRAARSVGSSKFGNR